MSMACEECRRLALGLASATAESAAISREINARCDASLTLFAWAREARSTMRAAFLALCEHQLQPLRLGRQAERNYPGCTRRAYSPHSIPRIFDGSATTGGN